MQVRPEQLATRLEQGLAPVYLVHGDEPLLVQEACDAIRAAARGQGYAEREVFQVEQGFEWGRLLEAANALSLFAERRILELRLPGGKPGKEGGEALRAYAGRPAEDTLLLVICGKLEPAQRKAKWYQALDEAGVSVQVWPVDAARLPAWIRQRMQGRGLRPSAAAAQLLAERVEGNLLAAAQEIDKLALLHQGEVDVDAVAAAVADSARFDIFGLVDAALAGEAGRCLRMLAGLRGEGVEPVLVVWALARELRALAGMARELAGGGSTASVMASHRVWKNRQPLVAKGLARYRPAAWQALLGKCAEIDRIVKGQAPGRPWDELVQLCLGMAGRPLGLAPRRP
ncbi:DNA polymerase III subunit delta [Thiohalobacter sp. IOR34]|uniref:DNA polymerase III subunit delta n=1 Tax=Thiohalobacter sp. IOR34 TaxID=3057176 RepID=UPI0025B062EA|nr:DNA polymerase III subunit delta [Thiohalobacter sp. IOR34]WJW74881.1 DNA polymerase III subunit delta [Thiohalobacter sp. IOR34]